MPENTKDNTKEKTGEKSGGDYWIEVCSVDDVPELEGRRVVIKGYHVGIFNTEEGFFATGDVCPHMGGPLSDGDVAATTISCPLHARKVDLRTGEVKNDDLSRVLTFPVEVHGNMIYVDASSLNSLDFSVGA